ncbi:MAG: UDP-4-amino-4,6-dideoxy-N-acetyl-beta-L-altrosamine N-acetyltransferase [Peptococcaceae bacterium]|nr:UDP-4-amino-4,6-dideoxy-N-acetyl-beta-L-altrosamine N-acetyltransferase [Peptococcaceae bacterium]
MLEWRNSDRIRAVMFTDRIITMDEHRAWFERLYKEKTAICRIFEFQDRPVGVVNIIQIDRHNHKCSWGVYLGEVDVPRGTGTVMGYLALEYIFEALGMRKLCAEVLAFNTTSIKFHKKLGFVEEGRFIKHVLKNGNYEDVIAMALFDEDWVKSKNKLKKKCFGSVG